LARRIVIQRVDREVAPDGIVLARAVDVVAHNATMFIDDMVVFGESVAIMLFGLRRSARAAGRDLHGLLAERHVPELAPLPDEARAPEHLVHLFGIGVGGDLADLEP